MPKIKFDGEELRILRKLTPYTQEELGEKIGISRETVSAIENNKTSAISHLTVEVVTNWTEVCESYADSYAMSRMYRHLKSVLGF